VSRSGDFERLGSLLPSVLGRGMPAERRLVTVWPEVVGTEVARNAQPRTLRGGRLVVATSSSVWAQTLQHMAGDILPRLNEVLAAGVDGQTEAVVIREVIFRPAGWDPGAGPGAPRELDSAPGGGDLGVDGLSRGQARSATRRRRRLTAAEEEAIEAVRCQAGDPELCRLISQAMRASLQRVTSEPPRR
jgi:hypothetical protein